MDLEQYLAPRRCFREPIPEISRAAGLLSAAADAHLAGKARETIACLEAADIMAVRLWTDSLWGSSKKHPEQKAYLRVRKVENTRPFIPKSDRVLVRMPSASEKAAIVKRYGYHCVFCGIPVVRAEVRRAFAKAYPDAAYWGKTNVTCHAAFQCLWLQYDHVVPHSRGGDSAVENLVVTCAGCNYGRVGYTLEEMGLLDPRDFERPASDWDGLERIFQRSS
jgi:5-methylcytosine-specific restriction endonuclease McrA